MANLSEAQVSACAEHFHELLRKINRLDDLAEPHPWAGIVNDGDGDYEDREDLRERVRRVDRFFDTGNAADADASARQQHDYWKGVIEAKNADGGSWSAGALNFASKKHPYLLDWRDMGERQRREQYVLREVVKMARDVAGL